ncbi:MAG: aconitate hydratase [Armatimonadetes bacterium]|nr:aconitate hydratase [Armatimonadota bacterium]
MHGTLAEKILSAHLVHGELRPGEEIAIRIDQTLTQDATGTMAYLQFEALGLDRVRTELSVSYVDHNTLQTGPENADDHRYLQSVAARYGIYFSRPGNGICHQVHLERFAVPGKTLLGSDSHTPTAGGIGSLAIGAGGLDVAVAMAGQPFYMRCPSVLGVRLSGQLRGWASAKDIILEILRRLTVKGGVGKILEYFGPGVAGLSVPERATITNMGAELGATSSLFPSDTRTQEFMTLQRRAEDWLPLEPEYDAQYEELIDVDLDELEPLVAAPHMPDRVVPVSELAGQPVDQVCIGSCTNSSLADLMAVAHVLRGRKVHPRVSLSIAPGSRQVLLTAARLGLLETFLAAGARILEAACGPCIGMGQAPPSGGVSVRSFNRNFRGRSGTPDAQVYLASPAVCAAAAVAGEFVDMQEVGPAPLVETPADPVIDDSMLISPLPQEEAKRVEIVRGPNIAPLPMRGPLEDEVRGVVLLQVGDNITTDDIMPAGAKILPLRSNIPAIAEYVFSGLDPNFSQRAKEAGGGFIVGGENYGQGSSREHAALAPMYLGIKAVFALSFARIHQANLVNFGILPLVIDREVYEKLSQGTPLKIVSARYGVETGEVEVELGTTGERFTAQVEAAPRQREILISGGLLNYVRERL